MSSQCREGALLSEAANSVWPQISFVAMKYPKKFSKDFPTDCKAHYHGGVALGLKRPKPEIIQRTQVKSKCQTLSAPS